jgi:NAD(P)-dependent dehydrogenase (short-subunit alcohol dehydrogenase family)
MGASFLSRSTFSPQVSEGSDRPNGDTLKVVGLECDVSSDVCVEKAFTSTIEAFGRVDVVIASAGEFPSLSQP